MMKEEKDNIDELIKQALSEEESEILERLGEEQSIFEQLLTNFQGKMKWMSMYIAFMILVFFIISIYCLIEFLNAEDLRMMMLWGAGMGASFLTVGMLKMWQWMQMDKNTLMREIKRLEIHIAALHKNKDYPALRSYP
jgi:hypothetical protein